MATTHRPRRTATHLSFAEWLVISEGVDANMGEWLKALAHYAKPEERRILDSLVGSGLLLPGQGNAGEYELRQDYDAIVKSVLKEKRKEDMNWLAFALGYLSVKAFRPEDLEIAIDVLEKMKTEGEVTRVEIGRLGWMRLGASMRDRISDYNRKATRISRTQSKKMAEKGEVAEADAHLIRQVAKEGDFDLYYLPPVSTEQDIEGRQRLLCKYGKGTDWCTAIPGGNAHRAYSNVGIFILHRGGKPKYQFVDCGDVPSRERDEDREDDYTIAQFMDVNDQPVESLSHEEKKLLSRQANISCYDLAEDGFEDMADFDSSSDEKVRASSGSTAAGILSVAGDRIGEVVARLGPALLRMNKGQVYGLTRSDSWNARTADAVLDALGGSIRSPVGGEMSGGSGEHPIITKALSLSSDPASKVKPLAGLISAVDIEEIFGNKPKDGDEILKSIVRAKKGLNSREAEKIVSLAADVKGMLETMGGEVAKLFSDDDPGATQMVYSRLSARKDGSLNDFSRFIEDNLAEMPPIAVFWAASASSDAEASARRMLSAGLNPERMKILFGMPHLAHLADDSHIRTIAKSRSKKEDDWGGVAALADRHGNSEGDERLSTVVRFLRNSDDLEGHEVMSAVTKANQKGQSDRLVELMPQDIIDLISLDDMKKAAEKAEKSCRPSWASPGSKEREECDEGRPLVAVMKRTRLNFPMGYFRFMKKGSERDGMIADKIGGSDWKASMAAMNLAEDKDLVAERIVAARDEKITPGEIASVLAHSKDKGKLMKKIGDKTGLLASKYETPYEMPMPSLDASETWMDWLTAVAGNSETIQDLMGVIGGTPSPLSVLNVIHKSGGDPKAVSRMAKQIRGMDKGSYEKLIGSIMSDRQTDKALAAVDDARHGRGIEKGDVVVAQHYPWVYAMNIPDEEQRRFVGKRVHIPRKDEMKYKVVGTEGEDIIISPSEPFESWTEGNYKVKVTPDWTFKAARKQFAREMI